MPLTFRQQPGNLLIDPHGHVRLIDFGIAFEGDEKSSPPMDNTECGTGVYMAPEVCDQSQLKP